MNSPHLISSRRLSTAAAVAVALALVAACSDDGGAEPTSAPTDSPSSPEETPSPTPDETSSPTTPGPDITTPPVATPPTPVSGPVEPTDVQEIVTGLDVPWSIAFLSADEALVSQRDTATIVHVTADGDVTEVGQVPGVEGEGEGGLLGIALHPDSPDVLYAYLTSGTENIVVRTTYDDGQLGELETVLDGIPAGTRHDGGRLAFGPDGMLYVSTGEIGDPPRAQDLDSLGGKILRITPDGDVPADNPFDGSPVFSYGHRNVEGLAFDDNGQLWASEFGANDVDELNRIEAGGNYGWPEVEGIGGDDRFIDPVLEWPVDDASPSGLAYHAQTLFMASLLGTQLWQIPIPGGEVGNPEAFINDYGRLRDAVVAPDGTLWVLTNNTDGRGDPRDGDDRILRLTLG